MSLIRPSLYISGNLADNVLYSIDVIWKFILWGERLKRFHNWRVTHIHYTSSFPSSLVQSIEHRAGNKLQQKWISLFFKVLLSHFHGKISQLGIHAQEFFFFWDVDHNPIHTIPCAFKKHKNIIADINILVMASTNIDLASNVFVYFS